VYVACRPKAEAGTHRAPYRKRDGPNDGRLREPAVIFSPIVQVIIS
jgi:hypothetical protein